MLIECRLHVDQSCRCRLKVGCCNKLAALSKLRRYAARPASETRSGRASGGNKLGARLRSALRARRGPWSTFRARRFEARRGVARANAAGRIHLAQQQQSKPEGRSLMRGASSAAACPPIPAAASAPQAARHSAPSLPPVSPRNANSSLGPACSPTGPPELASESPEPGVSGTAGHHER